MSIAVVSRVASKPRGSEMCSLEFEPLGSHTLFFSPPSFAILDETFVEAPQGGLCSLNP